MVIYCRFRGGLAIIMSLRAAGNKMLDLAFTLVRMVNIERANLGNIF